MNKQWTANKKDDFKARGKNCQQNIEAPRSKTSVSSVEPLQGIFGPQGSMFILVVC
jgi:hypothetical protein